MNVVPAPTVERTSIRPPWCSTMSLQMLSPSPVPRLAPPLVVKNGSKIFGSSLAGDARPGIAHLDADAVAVGGRLDGQRTALAEHRLAGVDQQVQQHLLQLHLVAVDGQPRLDLHGGGRCRPSAGRGPSTFSTSSTSSCTGTGPNAVGSPRANDNIDVQMRPALVLGLVALG